MEQTHSLNALRREWHSLWCVSRIPLDNKKYGKNPEILKFAPVMKPLYEDRPYSEKPSMI